MARHIATIAEILIVFEAVAATVSPGKIIFVYVNTTLFHINICLVNPRWVYLEYDTLILR